MCFPVVVEVLVGVMDIVVFVIVVFVVVVVVVAVVVVAKNVTDVLLVLMLLR